MHRIREHKECTLHGLINYDKQKRPFQHTLSVFPMDAHGAKVPAEAIAEDTGDDAAMACDGADGTAAHGPKRHQVAMFRAESHNVSLSCGGVFAPYEQSLRETEEDDCWGDEFEDFLFTMNTLGGAVEHKVAKLTV